MVKLKNKQKKPTITKKTLLYNSVLPFRTLGTTEKNYLYFVKDRELYFYIPAVHVCTSRNNEH